MDTKNIPIVGQGLLGEYGRARGQELITVGGIATAGLLYAPTAEERSSFAIGFTAANIPYYGIKAASVYAPTGSRRAAALDTLYGGLNVGSVVATYGFNLLPELQKGTDIGTALARAAGRSQVQIGVSDIYLESKTIDLLFESSKFAKGLKTTLGKQFETGTIRPSEYYTRLSALEPIEGLPVGAPISGRTDIPSGKETIGATEAKPFVIAPIKLTKPKTTAGTDTKLDLGKIVKSDPIFKGQKIVDIGKTTTKMELGKIDLGKLDVRFADTKITSKPEKPDIRPERTDIPGKPEKPDIPGKPTFRPDIKFEPKFELRTPSCKPEGAKIDLPAIPLVPPIPPSGSPGSGGIGAGGAGGGVDFQTFKQNLIGTVNTAKLKVKSTLGIPIYGRKVMAVEPSVKGRRTAASAKTSFRERIRQRLGV
jgi:hypothetical protein